MSRAEFYQRLHEALHNGSDLEAFSRQVWQEVGGHRAILVGDLSGFTRNTRLSGVVRFLAVHCRWIEIAAAVVERRQGQMIKIEADNFIATFERAHAALEAAREIGERSRALNDSLDDADRIRPCFGLDEGPVLWFSDDAYGDPVNVAFKLGEDIARPFELLLTADTAAGLDGELDEAEAGTMRIADVEVPYRRLHLG